MPSSSDDSDVNMDELDAMSSSDEEDSSEDDQPGMLGSFMEAQKKKSQMADYEGFDDDDEGTVVDKMKTILALRASLGIDDDKSFLADQEVKATEKRRLEKMTHEERIEYEEGQAGDVMARIRAKHAEKMKEVEAKRQEEKAVAVADVADPPAGLKKKKKKKPKDGEEDPAGAVGPDGEKKKKKKKKLLGQEEAGATNGREAPARRSLKKGGSERPLASTSTEEAPVKRGKPKRAKSSDGLDSMIAAMQLSAAKEGDDAPKKKTRPKGSRRASTAADGRPDTSIEGVKRKKKVSSKKKPLTMEDI
mmetsp:Transcript_2678/g.3584  ORF Transcript_2678/g.3584 Transcript_2678/m.3584 type:complete len:305 (+) Transcript_2678:118-1032(+)|eukprot:CAMPEP_0198150680 /NCGR_PEP_ID=MMETSP1443-20131203/51935_1 /TAXON_ID=186043 /ORGANISM="Entomoneis sp., Strain CCMP2396" /LENGTH=304 /DNA_ID=CAMNT_0043816065 /DNA_START=37 /DNA_END=951 /DNA_ORIENTATION=-